jgi:hypothetical protein
MKKMLANGRRLGKERGMRPFPFILSCTFLAVSVLLGAEVQAQNKPVLLYSRYYNAAGEDRYLPDGTYQQVLQRLREEFDVRVHNLPLTPQTLAGVKLVLIANPSEKAVGTNPPPPHVSPRDIETLATFIDRGGGLIVMGNQENHNLEINDLNRLLASFGLQFTNLYTDVKKIVLPKGTPVIGGLRWGYYTGNLVTIDPANPARPRALVENDLTEKPLNGVRNQKGCLLALAEPGRGRVVVATDSGWVTNGVLNDEGIGGVAVKGQDNWEIFRRLARWASHLPPEK